MVQWEFVPMVNDVIDNFIQIHKEIECNSQIGQCILKTIRINAIFHKNAE